jgi:hypothetical protein
MWCLGVGVPCTLVEIRTAETMYLQLASAPNITRRLNLDTRQSSDQLHTSDILSWVHTVTLPRTVTPYRDSVDGTRDHVTYQKLVTR